MDSPYINPSTSAPRSRADSSFSLHSTESGNIRKRSISRPSRPRSISAANVERNPSLLPEQLQDQLHLRPGPPGSSGSWTPTNPPPSQPDISTQNLHSQLPTEQLRNLVVQSTDQPLATSTSTDRRLQRTSSDMTSLGYLPAHQYGNMAFQDPAFDSNYQNLDSHTSMPQTSNLNFLFSQPPSQNRPIYSPGPLQMEPFSGATLEPAMTQVSDPALSSINRTASPFQRPSYDGRQSYDGIDYPSMASGQPVASSRSISHSPLPAHQLDTINPPMGPGRSPSLYESSIYATSFTSTSTASQHYPAPTSFSYPPPQQPRQSLGRTESQVRVLNSKPKPQCWDHGCNGREFSTFSNLLRHQREKSGTAQKSYCPKCGAEFTRTTARNGHLAHEKCSKPRRASDDK